MGTTITTSAISAVTPCGTTSATALERTRFFPRQLIGPDDLTQDQIYFREKLRRHNRMLHGWGVACGVGVRRGQTSCEVIVDPGYILGPFGDEIVIDQSTTFDVCQQSSGQCMGCGGEQLDPWCADVRANCKAGMLYLAVRYQECQARPVRASSCGCGCDDATCQYSRTRDSFTLTLLDALPAGYTSPMTVPGTGAIAPCSPGPISRPCPPCPSSPWVIIADLTVGSDCTVTAIDCFAHRRYVISWGNFYELCNSRQVSALAAAVASTPAGNPGSTPAPTPILAGADMAAVPPAPAASPPIAPANAAAPAPAAPETASTSLPITPAAAAALPPTASAAATKPAPPTPEAVAAPPAVGGPSVRITAPPPRGNVKKETHRRRPKP
jgi:hypothetical protein